MTVGKHGKWTVDFDYGWNATHDDFDADWLGEEDGWQGNGLYISGCQTYKDLLLEIANHERADDYADPIDDRPSHVSAASGDNKLLTVHPR